MVSFMNSSFEYCRQIVRDHDYDRYIVSLFSRKPPALWALFAFHYEIARTRFVVSEPTLGLIRLQWWRDEIGKVYVGESHAAGEVLDALAEVVTEYKMPQEWLEAMILAREVELRGEVQDSVEGALEYLEMVQTPLLRAALYIADGGSNSDPIEAVALNYGVMDAIRRAEKNSLVAQNFDAFEVAFHSGVRSESRVLGAFQVLAEIWMRDLRRSRKSGKAPRIPVCLAFRIWTKLLWL
jgi:phytoene synthase